MAPATNASWDNPSAMDTSVEPAREGSQPGIPCAPPIASLITLLRRCTTFTADVNFANKVIAPIVHQLSREDQELQRLLACFGWHGKCFICPLDIRGLQAALQKHQYIKRGVIGVGAYGAVYRVVNRETQEKFAIKQVRVTEHGLCETTIREISAMRELRHFNIVRLRDVIATPSSPYCYLVLELLDTDLYTLLYKRMGAPPMELGLVKSIMYQILAGLRHAHVNGVMHRDLKPQNILIDINGYKFDTIATTPPSPFAPPIIAAAPSTAGTPVTPNTARFSSNPSTPFTPPSPGHLRVKIADFGLARPYLPDADGAYTDWVVTLYYRAPELLLGCRHYGPGLDVWSAGCVMAELFNGGPLFVAESEIGLLRDMFRKLGSPPPEVVGWMPGLAAWGDITRAPLPWTQLVPRLAQDPRGADLLASMLCYDTRLRLSASQALAHPWFDEIRETERAVAAAAAGAGMA